MWVISNSVWPFPNLWWSFSTVWLISYCLCVCMRFYSGCSYPPPLSVWAGLHRIIILMYTCTTLSSWCLMVFKIQSCKKNACKMIVLTCLHIHYARTSSSVQTLKKKKSYWEYCNQRCKKEYIYQECIMLWRTHIVLWEREPNIMNKKKIPFRVCTTRHHSDQEWFVS